MNFEESKEFQKEFRYFLKKYRSLLEDLKEFKKSVSVAPLGNQRNFSVLRQNNTLIILKARFFCRYLKGKSLRIIYAYFEKEEKIEFIEIYFKGKNKKENKERINEYFKTWTVTH